MKFKLTLLFLLISLAVFSGLPHKPNSILATGRWYKVSIFSTGIYKISFEDFLSMGMDPSQLVKSSDIRIFGNGGGMLSETNSAGRIDDLREISISVADGNDGKIDPGDYILFYGESPDNWIFNSTTRLFTHSKNLYSDSTYYFITTDLGIGKRVLPVASVDSIPNSYSRRSSGYALHEVDSVNLIKSGKLWLGELFSVTKNIFEFRFSIPDADTNSAVRIITNVVGRAPVISYFNLSYKNQLIDSIQVDLTDLGSTESYFGRMKQRITLVTHPDTAFNLQLTYPIQAAGSIAWLNFIELNYQRNLSWVPPQMPFCDVNSIGPKKITEFILTRAAPSVVVWNITDPANIREIITNFRGDTIKFKVTTDSLRLFHAFDRSAFYRVHYSGRIDNQNLHAIDPAQLVIVTNPVFKNQADRLASFHRMHNDLSVLVVTTTQIYNEFSSGAKELTAIRDFMKMLYDKGNPGNRPEYLLLFGDGSYDPKNRIRDNMDMIPTFESTESLNFGSSFVTDDYFGIMSDNKGLESNGRIDIGIGRFPVSTVDQAKTVVDKIINYSSYNDTVFSNWRNNITFIADSPNHNLHMHQATDLADIVYEKYPVLNVNKIFFDAYQLVNTPSGGRIPGANQAITDAIMKGTILLNYTGHGGETGWSAEKTLTLADIRSWNNWNKLPIFVTATCEFSRFDNPQRFTAGEELFIKPDGGAIALFSTTRLAFSTTNFQLDTSFISNLMSLNGGPNPRLGDLIRISKNNNGNNAGIRNFVLLGDPAQKIAFPAHKIVTTTINSVPTSEHDTIRGMSLVTVKGQVQDNQGNKMPSYNGTLFAKVFDKPYIYKTLGNFYPDNYPENFPVQDVLLYNGKASVTSGEFQFTFILPKDISLKYGKGKFSYYALDDSTDAGGYDSHVVFGGENNGSISDQKGPDISLYMDDKNFISGGKTSSSPVLLAYLHDTSGINYLGLGLGHEIIEILDKNTASSMVLNDYYEPDLDSYQSGIVFYPMSNLQTGLHTLSVRAWDMLDNSFESQISFFVFDQPGIVIQNVYNFPNPFREKTTFAFSPVQKDGDMDVQILVFSFTGRLMKTIRKSLPQSTEIPVFIVWDGTSDNGKKLSSGIYFYRLLITGQNGTTMQTTQKLVLLN